MAENQTEESAGQMVLVLLHTVKLKDGYHFPDEIIECEKKEAERLIQLKVALPAMEINPADSDMNTPGTGDEDDPPDPDAEPPDPDTGDIAGDMDPDIDPFDPNADPDQAGK